MIPKNGESQEVIHGAVVGNKAPGEIDFLPKPDGADQDQLLYKAWQDHMVRGFEQNNLMFQRVLNGFMRPYWIAVAMYVLLFTIGIGGFITAVVLAFTRGLEFSLLFGGMSVLAFLGFFISHPLRALEQNLLFITWLGVIYNNYWTRLMYANKVTSLQEDLEAIEKNTIAELNQLVNKHEKLARQRPGIQDESDKKEPIKSSGGG